MPVVVEIESLEPGMVVDEPVVNRRGQLLLGPGARITERTIAVLRGFGIRSVIISGEDERELTVADLAAAEARLRSRMLFAPEHVLEHELFDEVVKYHTRRDRR